MQPDFQILAVKQGITATIRNWLLSLRITDEAGAQPVTVEIQISEQLPVVEIARQQGIGYLPEKVFGGVVQSGALFDGYRV